MNDYIFQLAVRDDIPEIIKIYHSVIGTPGCTWSFDYPNVETAEEDIKNNWLYTLKNQNIIVAVASAGKFDDWEHLQWDLKNPCELARIGVNPMIQSQGIGTIILKNIINEMKQQGFDGIRFIVSKSNHAALALYEKNGFKKCGETFVFDLDWYCYQMVF